MTVRTLMDAAPYGFEPKNLAQMRIEASQKIRRRQIPNGRFVLVDSGEIPLSTFSSFEQSWNVRYIWKGFEQDIPCVLSLPDDTHVKFTMGKEELIVGRNLRST